jgi:hypothetical protein
MPTRRTRWGIWFRYCATNRKVAGSIPDVVIGGFHWHNLPGRTMGLGSTQPLTDKSTRRPVRRVTTLPPSCTDCHEIWELKPPGTLRVCPGLYRDCFTFFTRRHSFHRSFATFRKIACEKRQSSSCLSIRPSARMLGSNWADFREIWYLRIF